MEDAQILLTLKQNLELLHSAKDDYLTDLIKAAKEAIAREGIVLGEGYEDLTIVAMYAAYFYRQRAGDGKMPMMLRSALNNKLVSQKATVADV